MSSSLFYEKSLEIRAIQYANTIWFGDQWVSVMGISSLTGTNNPQWLFVNEKTEKKSGPTLEDGSEWLLNPTGKANFVQTEGQLDDEHLLSEVRNHRTQEK